jgi:site-specific recombinase XerD
VRFTTAVDLFFADMRLHGRITSPGTETAYRQVLNAHATDIGNRDPRTVNRDDIKRTLARWPHPNTQASRHAALTSFFDWAMEEGIRRDNPARQVRRARRKPTAVYRLTREEAAAMLAASLPDQRTRWAIHLGICAGLRSAELRGLRGRHFQRPGFIHVSADIAKRGKERWVPVLGDLAAIVVEIIERVGLDDHVLPGSKAGGGSFGSDPYWRADPHRPMSSQTLQRLVHETARRAGIAAHVHPHLMRHAYGDHIARHAGIKNAQALLGHADVSTTQTYTGQPTLEELAAAIAAFSYQPRTGVPSLSLVGASSESGEGGIRTLGPVVAHELGLGPELEQWLTSLAPSIATYEEALR